MLASRAAATAVRWQQAAPAAWLHSANAAAAAASSESGAAQASAAQSGEERVRSAFSYCVNQVKKHDYENFLWVTQLPKVRAEPACSWGRAPRQRPASLCRGADHLPDAVPVATVAWRSAMQARAPARLLLTATYTTPHRAPTWARPPLVSQEQRAPVFALRAFAAELQLIDEHAKSETLAAMRCAVRAAALWLPVIAALPPTWPARTSQAC